MKFRPELVARREYDDLKPFVIAWVHRNPLRRIPICLNLESLPQVQVIKKYI